MVDYIANYLDTIEERRVTPAIEPGYLRRLVPLEAPQNPEHWDDIMKDVEDKIMPGVSGVLLGGVVVLFAICGDSIFFLH